MLDSVRVEVARRARPTGPFAGTPGHRPHIAAVRRIAPLRLEIRMPHLCRVANAWKGWPKVGDEDYSGSVCAEWPEIEPRNRQLVLYADSIRSGLKPSGTRKLRIESKRGLQRERSGFGMRVRPDPADSLRNLLHDARVVADEGLLDASEHLPGAAAFHDDSVFDPGLESEMPLAGSMGRRLRYGLPVRALLRLAIARFA